MSFHRQGWQRIFAVACGLFLLGSMTQAEAQRTRRPTQKTKNTKKTTAPTPEQERDETTPVPPTNKASRSTNAFLKSVEAGDVARAKSLLDQGASVRQTDAQGHTALHLAIAHVPMVRLILENKANVNSTDKKGRTPLILSAVGGYIGTVEELIQAEARVDVRDTEGLTALASAVLNRRPRTVALLIANGANVHIQDNAGRTPRDMAREVKDTQILKMLESAVANPTQTAENPRPRPNNNNAMNPQNPRDPDLARPPKTNKGGTQPPTTDRITPTDRTPVLRHAQELLLAAGTENERSRAAQRYFEGLTEKQLHAEIEAIRRNQTRGSLGYRSVSYVLAFYGIDVIQNAQRVMYEWLYPDVFGDEPRTKQADPTPDAVKRIYQRHPSDDLLAKMLLVARQNRVTHDEPQILLADLFIDYPNAMLRAAALRSPEIRDTSLSALAKALEGYAGYRRVQRILRDLGQSPERGMARAAQDLQAELDRIRKN